MPRKLTIEDVLARIERGPGCWLWTGAVSSSGYGQVGSRRHRRYAHRLVYEHFRGPIPLGMVLDHVKARDCTSTLCVNPDHLEPVTSRINILRGDSPAAQNARKASCSRGHSDWYIRPDGEGRLCRTCLKLRRQIRAGREARAA